MKRSADFIPRPPRRHHQSRWGWRLVLLLAVLLGALGGFLILVGSAGLLEQPSNVPGNATDALLGGLLLLGLAILGWRLCRRRLRRRSDLSLPRHLLKKHP